MRRRIERMLFHVAVTFAILSVPTLAGGTYLPHHYFKSSPSVIRQNSHSLSRSRRSKNNCFAEDITTTTFMSSRSQRVISNIQKQQAQEEEAARQVSELEDVSYNDLGPIGKAVAGSTEIVFATVFDYCSGYLQGLVLGTLFGSPGFVFRPMTKGMRQPFMTEISSRFVRMNTRSLNWGKKFGALSATFGGFGVAVKVLRNGEKDAWNDILSSAAAGAFFARKEGPQAMLRGAVLYGGLIYFTSGSKRNQIQEYTETPANEF